MFKTNQKLSLIIFAIVLLPILLFYQNCSPTFNAKTSAVSLESNPLSTPDPTPSSLPSPMPVALPAPSPSPSPSVPAVNCTPTNPTYTTRYTVNQNDQDNGLFGRIFLPNQNSGNLYYLSNNVWGPTVGVPNVGDQIMWVKSESCWGITTTHNLDSDSPKSYPSVVRGWVRDVGTANGFQLTNRGSLGIKVTALKKAHIHWTMSAPTVGRYQALWDIYLHDGTANPGANATMHTSLMINQRLLDNGYYASTLRDTQRNVGEATYGGKTFVIYVEGPATNTPSTYWASGNTIQLFLKPVTGNLWGSESMTLDLKEVIDDMRRRGYISDNDYLNSINTGWEVNVGQIFTTLNYWTALQDELDGPN